MASLMLVQACEREQGGFHSCFTTARGCSLPVKNVNSIWNSSHGVYMGQAHGGVACTATAAAAAAATGR